MTSLERWLIVEKNLLTFFANLYLRPICVCICVCICACICVCISDWLRRKTCWLLRPHQDQSRVAPPAKCWKPRSLSTVLPTPVVQIRHQQQIAAARSQTPSLQIFTRTHLTSMAVDIFVSTVSCISSIACLTLGAHSVSGTLAQLRCSCLVGLPPLTGVERQRVGQPEARRGAGAHTGHVPLLLFKLPSALSFMSPASCCLADTLTNCFSQLLLLEESCNRFICPTLYSAASWIWFISLHQSRSHHVTTTMSCLAISPLLTCHVRNHSKFKYKCH